MDDDTGPVAPGLEPGGGVAPGDTPPAEGQTPQAASDNLPGDSSTRTNVSRVPMIVTLTLIGLMVLGVLVYLVASIIGHSGNAGSTDGAPPPAHVTLR